MKPWMMNMLVVLGVSAVLVLVLYVAFRPPTPEEVQRQELVVQAWAKKVNMPIVGVSCGVAHRTCDVVPVAGRPFQVVCTAMGCTMVGCQ